MVVLPLIDPSLHGHAAAAEAAPLILAMVCALAGAWMIRHDENGRRALGWTLMFVAGACVLIALLALPYVAQGR